MDLDALNRRFAIDPIASFDIGRGDLPRLKISSPFAEAEIYLHGAHVTGYTPRGQEPVLFMSDQSVFKPGKAIRGGVPICFPWFGPKADDPKAPAHGFARASVWDVESLRAMPDGGVMAIFVFNASDDTRSKWPHNFTARYGVCVSDTLNLSLLVTSTDSNAFHFEEAMHSYFVVGDVKRIDIDGLGGTDYLDKVNAAALTPQSMEPIRFTGETDRVYLKTRHACVVTDPVLKRTITIEKTGSDATVVWNPWIAKAKALSDFGDEEWPGMVCVETCNVGQHAVVLAPSASHKMTATISVQAL